MLSDDAGIKSAPVTKGSLIMIRETQRAEAGRLAVSSAQLGVWIFLATATMLFAGFTSAYLVRQTGSDWRPIPLPPLLWLNTGVILASSFSLERGRARLHARSGRRWLLAAWLLGIAFLAGQVMAWKFLADRGVYLPTNPHSSFFYILTGVHGLHVMGGLAALASVFLIRKHMPAGRWEQRLKVCATYWHFVGALWLYLFVVLFVLG